MSATASQHYEFVVQRDGERPLAFEGELLADVSNAQRPKKRWSEIRIYRTTSDRYVVETVGMTTVPGEQPIRRVSVVEQFDSVPDALRRNNPATGESYLTGVASQAIAEAQAKDWRQNTPHNHTLVERI